MTDDFKIEKGIPLPEKKTAKNPVKTTKTKRKTKHKT